MQVAENVPDRAPVLFYRDEELGGFRLRGKFNFKHKRDGKVIDEWDVKNLVVNQGVEHALDVSLSNGTQESAWYVMLKDSGAVAAGDTYQQVGGTNAWDEVTDYTEGTRPTWTDGGVSGKSLDNSGSPASFSINATVTVDGCALVSSNVKSDVGAGETLFAAADFASAKSLSSGDTLEVTYTITGDDDGV